MCLRGGKDKLCLHGGEDKLYPLRIHICVEICDLGWLVDYILTSPTESQLGSDGCSYFQEIMFTHFHNYL